MRAKCGVRSRSILICARKICVETCRITYCLARSACHSTCIPFGHQVAVRLDRAVSRVVRAVGAAHRVQDQDALHRARKALKQLRALLAPFVSQLPALGELYDSATRGQDTLGAMRDAGLLADRARKEKLTALAAALDNVKLGHFNAFASEWMEDAGTRALSGHRYRAQDVACCRAQANKRNKYRYRHHRRRGATRNRT